MHVLELGKWHIDADGERGVLQIKAVGDGGKSGIVDGYLFGSPIIGGDWDGHLALLSVSIKRGSSPRSTSTYTYTGRLVRPRQLEGTFREVRGAGAPHVAGLFWNAVR